MWRGEPFARLDTPWVNAVRESVNRERLAAELDRNDLALGRGDYVALLPVKRGDKPWTRSTSSAIPTQMRYAPNSIERRGHQVCGSPVRRSPTAAMPRLIASSLTFPKPMTSWVGVVAPFER
jgi:hypothetical protein